MGVSIKLYSMSLYIPQMNQVLDGRIRGQSLQSDYSLMALFNTISMIGYMCFFNLKTYFNEKFHLKNIRYMLYGVALFYSLYSLALALLDTRIFELFYNQGFVIFYGFLNSFLFLVALFMVLKQLKREFSQIKYLTINIVVYLSIALMTGALILNNTFVDYQTLQFLIQLSLVLVLFIRSIYIGLSKYLRSDKKIVLYILSSFPIYFLVKYAFFGVDFVNIIANNLIIKLTIVAIFFSILTIIYYSLETLLLWYAYRTKMYTSDLKEVEIETEYHIVVLIPCMNEELVIRNTVQSLLNTGYSNLEIYVIDDASEDDTVGQLEEFKNDSHFQLLRRVKPEAQQGKGEALNWAYQKVVDKYLKNRGIFENTLITIIDADSSVPIDYFKKVNRVFNSDFELTGLQSKVQIINKDGNTAQDLEFGEIINATQSLRTKTNTVAFGGNGQFCKLSTLYSLRELPWTNSLVEDFDLSLRIFLSEIYNVRNVQYDDIMITQTGIYGDHQALVKQRVRWAQGNIQTFKYLYKIIKSDNLLTKQKLELIFTLLKPWLMTIEYVVVIYTIIVMAGTIIIDGFTRTIDIFILMFAFMVLYIFIINLVWSILYNLNQKRNQNTKFKWIKVFKDTYYLTRFLILLTQIYPQATIRYFTAQNGWDKTKRQ